jgi:hypothetical protein
VDQLVGLVAPTSFLVGVPLRAGDNILISLVNGHLVSLCFDYMGFLEKSRTSPRGLQLSVNRNLDRLQVVVIQDDNRGLIVIDENILPMLTLGETDPKDTVAVVHIDAEDGAS